MVDVIVADGFSGNIALKVFEGTARTIVGEIRSAVLGSLRAKIGAAIMSRDLRKISEALDPEQYGGAYLLGLRRPMIVGHGSSHARGVASGIRTASRGVTSELLPTIARRLGGDGSRQPDDGRSRGGPLGRRRRRVAPPRGSGRVAANLQPEVNA